MDAIIVGGGIAGLSAAAELVGAGRKVVVLEARERFGGRVHTIQSGGVPIELGAEFIHGCDPELWRAIGAAHLRTHPVSEQNRSWENGQFRPADIWEDFGDLMTRVNLRVRDRSFREFLAKQKIPNPTRRLLTLFVEGFNAAAPGRISVRALARAEKAAEKIKGDYQARLDLGYSSLVEVLEKKLRRAGVQLVTKAVVSRISWKRGEVEIIGAPERWVAPAAVITLPLGVWKARDVMFSPPLKAKEKAVTGLAFGNVMRISFLFKRQWWEGGDFGFVHSPDDVIPTWWSDPRGSVLTGWAGGPRADRLSGSNLTELKKVGIGILARIFNRTRAFILSELVSVAHHNWATDPFAHGAYSYIPVGAIALPNELAKPVQGTLFFAGEATVPDAQMGTVFGAFESGIRAARELIAATE